jgi:hypothetical protein
MNPYTQGLIKLQNNKFDVPDRMFNSYQDLEKILEDTTDNRELIPDFFCYIDYFINLNCSFFGINNNKEIIDDFIITIPNQHKNIKNNINYVSNLIELLYKDKKLLNSTIISKTINNWVDIIFGKKQLPKKDDLCDSCNIYKSYSYEQKTQLEKKIEHYQIKIAEKKRL